MRESPRDVFEKTWTGVARGPQFNYYPDAKKNFIIDLG